jgi:hypothetical protein
VRDAERFLAKPEYSLGPPEQGLELEAALAAYANGSTVSHSSSS